ncbi:hypothetical protein QUB12_11240 [Microcoleus sp. B7-D4]
MSLTQFEDDYCGHWCQLNVKPSFRQGFQQESQSQSPLKED